MTASTEDRVVRRQTMGAAELGRELGDAGGPLLVAAVAGHAATPQQGEDWSGEQDRCQCCVAEGEGGDGR